MRPATCCRRRVPCPSRCPRRCRSSRPGTGGAAPSRPWRRPRPIPGTGEGPSSFARLRGSSPRR
ncbi:hypothetical protein CH063_16061 [Colletotrichum higginsianum]|uniref:Uncharacterized protein n=1 Tax=Colletotrichum higginsianum (strain IMI 349063) TaxID=759273 RepID=H1W5S3_COLHI|nr:hypothetical protein CH063_16061 [Colletotrichum higginsianum]